MNDRGKVTSGGVVLPEDVRLPEGAEVIASVPERSPTAPASPPVWGTLSEPGRRAETLPTDLPPDLSANHDHDLHGLPTRRDFTARAGS